MYQINDLGSNYSNVNNFNKFYHLVISGKQQTSCVGSHGKINVNTDNKTPSKPSTLKLVI